MKWMDYSYYYEEEELVIRHPSIFIFLINDTMLFWC